MAVNIPWQLYRLSCWSGAIHVARLARASR